MSDFKHTTHLSEILEESSKKRVVVFKFSSSCNSSSSLRERFETMMAKYPLIIYLVTARSEPVLSRKIAEHFQIKHESPQIVVIEKGKVVYSADHDNIDIKAVL